MKSAGDIFHELKISERPSRAGTFMTTCPQCSHLRKKKNDRCLSVKVDSLGIQYFCHHCQWNGGQYYDGSADTRTNWRPGNGKARSKPRDRRPIGSFYR